MVNRHALQFRMRWLRALSCHSRHDHLTATTRTKRSPGLNCPMFSLQNLYSKTAGSKREWHLPVYESRSSLDRWQYLTQVVFHQRTLRLCLLLVNLIRRYGRHKTLNHCQTLIKFTAKIAQFTDRILVRRSVGRRNWLEISSNISLIRRRGNVIKVKCAEGSE